mgnify:CR=1 FL=1
MHWILAIVLLPVVFLLGIALFAPVIAGEWVMKKALRRCGVPVKLLPRQFIRDSVAACLEAAKSPERDAGVPVRTGFMRLLQQETYSVCRILEISSGKPSDGPADPDDNDLLASKTAKRMRGYGLL